MVTARKKYQIFGLFFGLFVFGLMISSEPRFEISEKAWIVASITCLMSIWWITEALPISATSLLPLVAFPAFEVMTIKEAATAYSHPIVLLIFGGFIIAAAMQKWNLHKRIALNIINKTGTKPNMLIAGFMLSTASISMWVSNTATTIMMLPIALSVINFLEERKQNNKLKNLDYFSLALLLSIAYAASIGGLGTLIGTAPNALFAAYMEEHFNISVGFFEWMLIGIPMALLMLILAWLSLTKITFRLAMKNKVDGVHKIITNELRKMGNISQGEKTTAAVFAIVALAWISRPFIQSTLGLTNITDTVIAITGAMTLLILPVSWKKRIFVLDRDWPKTIPWEILILFGGGLSLAGAISDSGLTNIIGENLEQFHNWELWTTLLAITATVIFLTELTSNTATAIILLPIGSAFSSVINVDPNLILIPIVIAASCAFMLPISTPPNAIIFSSGKISVPDMAKAGLSLNLLAILGISFLSYFFVGSLVENFK